MNQETDNEYAIYYTGCKGREPRDSGNLPVQQQQFSPQK